MKVVIIGGGTSGVETARQLRFLDKKIKITIIDEEGLNQYSPCSLPYFVEGKVKDVEVYNSYEKDSIDYLRNAIVTKRKGKVLTVKQGSKTSELSYDKLVIAAGSKPKRISDKGFVLKTKSDAEKIKKLKGNFLIVGAGYIGLELSASLALKKQDVLVVESEGKVMPGLDKDLADYVQSYVESLGVKFKLNSKSSIESYKFDHLIQCVGFEPNSKVFEELNFKYEKGLKVEKDVFVVGDLAKTKNKVTSNYEHCMFATTAVKQARSTAKQILGIKDDYDGFVLNGISKIGSLIVGIVGSNGDVIGKFKGLDKYASCGGKDYFVKVFTDKKGIITGGQILGFSEVAGRLNMLSSFVGKSVHDLVKVDTCYNPCVSPINDPLVEAGKICIKKLEYLK